MTWLVFGVSCLLVLAGAVSIISGAPIVQLERGWTEVISGAIALSSGGVVFALAVVLVRLEGLRDTLAARAIAPPVEVAVAGPALPAPVTPAPKREAEPPAPPVPALDAPTSDQMEANPPVPDSEPEHGLWKRIRRPTEAPDRALLESKGFPDRVLPEPMPPAPVAAERATVIVPPHTPPRSPSVEPEAPKPGDGDQIGWLERSLAKGRAGRSAEPKTAPSGVGVPNTPAVAPGGRVEPSLGTAPALFGTPEPTPAGPAPTSDPEAADLHAAGSPDGPSVIGRYQAGSSSYIMYSDGTIEVETEDGQTHRFGSMDELKAYIASQDTTET